MTGEIVLYFIKKIRRLPVNRGGNARKIFYISSVLNILRQEARDAIQHRVILSIHE